MSHFQKASMNKGRLWGEKSETISLFLTFKIKIQLVFALNENSYIDPEQNTTQFTSSCSRLVVPFLLGVCC